MERTEKYHKDKNNESLSALINARLEQVEYKFLNEGKFDIPQKPVVIIVGAPRSGTTVMHQLLAATGLFGYISNFVARFWRAPYLGSLLEKIMGVREEKMISYASDHGRTSGIYSPHDFAYFWRRWFRYNDDHMMNPSLSEFDMSNLAREVAALEDVNSKPMVFKNLFCSLQIPYIKACIPTAKFVICTRDISYQMQSILGARQSFFGNIDGWFSVKPSEYKTLKKMTPYEQISGQVHYILHEIFSGLKQLDKDDYTFLKYKDITQTPRESVKKILGMIGTTENPGWIPYTFSHRNQQRVTDDEWKKIEEVAWREWRREP